MTTLGFLAGYVLVGIATLIVGAFMGFVFMGAAEIAGAVRLGLAVWGGKRRARRDAPRCELLTCTEFHWDGSHQEYRTARRKGGWV